MTFDLEDHGDPIRGYPAMVLRSVSLCNPDDVETCATPLVGIIDTGCDFAVVPQKVIDELQLQPVDFVKANTATGSEILPVYQIHMQSPGIGMLNTFAIGVSNRETVLIGRRCLSHTRLTIDWPAKKWSIEPIAPH